MFLALVLELKGIKGYLREMNIVLNSSARPIKHHPYWLNPRVKEKAKREIDKMLITRLIFPVDESRWIIPIFIQDKKDFEDIRVCVDYHILNNAYVYDPFPTPFNDEVLDNVAV